jgi:hypothetical protein
VRTKAQWDKELAEKVLRRPHFHATLAGSFDDNQQSIPDYRHKEKCTLTRGKKTFPKNATTVVQRRAQA